MGEKLRVLLADDHELVRQGVRRMLELEEDIEVVGEASSGGEAVVQAAALSPDVIIMDIQMPGFNGLEATRQLKERGLPGEIIIVSMYEEYLAQAIESGAMGYLAKNTKREELVNAVRRVRDGEMVLAPSLLSSPAQIDAVLKRFLNLVQQRIGDHQVQPEKTSTAIPLAVGAHSTRGRETAVGSQPQPPGPWAPPGGAYPQRSQSPREEHRPEHQRAEGLPGFPLQREDVLGEDRAGDALPTDQQPDTHHNPLAEVVEEQRHELRRQFAELVQSLAREHALLYELERVRPVTSRKAQLLDALPAELRKPAASIEEFAGVLHRLIEEGRLPRYRQARRAEELGAP